MKHTISTLKVFEKTNIQFGYMDYDSDYTVITVHREWNLIFFVGAKRRIIAQDMDRRKVNVILASVDRSYGSPVTVHEHTLLSSLCSLVLVLGVISKAVNKAAFDVCLCHDMFKSTNVV